MSTAIRAVTALITFVVGLGVVSSPAVAAPPVEVGRGHVDIGPHPGSAGFELRARDDTGATPVWRDLADVVLRVNDHASATIPDDPAFRFLGEAAGKQAHVIPQTENPKALWLGWNTQDPRAAADLPRGVDLILKEHQGPGALHVFIANGFDAPLPLWDSASPGGKIHVEPNTHVHANWVFTAPGEHRVSVEMVGRDRAGKDISHTATLRFLVGDSAVASAESTAVASPSSEPTPSAATATASTVPTVAATPPSSPAPPTSAQAAPGWLVPAIGAGSLAVVAGLLLLVRQRARRADALDSALYEDGGRP